MKSTSQCGPLPPLPPSAAAAAAAAVLGERARDVVVDGNTVAAPRRCPAPGFPGTPERRNARSNTVCNRLIALSSPSFSSSFSASSFSSSFLSRLLLLCFLLLLLAAPPAAATSGCSSSSTAGSSPFTSATGSLLDGYECTAGPYTNEMTCDDLATSHCFWEINPASAPFLTVVSRQIADGDIFRLWDGDAASAVPAKTLDGVHYSAPVSGYLVLEFLPNEDGFVSFGWEVSWTTTAPSVCGDATTTHGWEVCDVPGGNGIGTGCSADCTSIETGYSCAFAGDDCNDGCGDWLRNTETEECDDGNNVDGDGCSAACRVEGNTCDGTHEVITASSGFLSSSAPGDVCIINLQSEYDGKLDVQLVEMDMLLSSETGEANDDAVGTGSWDGFDYTFEELLGLGQTIISPSVEYEAPHDIHLVIWWFNSVIAATYPDRRGAYIFFQPRRPTIAAASSVPTSGGTVTIEGEDFPTDTADLVSVKIGGIDCTPTSATESEIECTLPGGGRGGVDFAVEIIVAGGATGLGLHAHVESPLTLVEHWTMNEVAATDTILVGVFGELNGLLGSGTSFTLAGCQSAGCLAFDGSNNAYVDINQLATIDATAVTISVWIRRDGPTGSAAGRIFTKSTSSNNNDVYMRLGMNSDWGFQFLMRLNNIVFTLTASLEVPLGAWMHVVASKVGTELFLFVDGAQVATMDTGNSVVTAADVPIAIGNERTNRAYAFNGLIDDMRIYATGVSTPAEAQALATFDNVAEAEELFAFDPPSITSASISEGSATGGYIVTLSGTSLGDPSTPQSYIGDLSLDGTAICTPSIVSSTEITCSVPDLSAETGLCDTDFDWEWTLGGQELDSSVPFTSVCCALTGFDFATQPQTSPSTTFGQTLPVQPIVHVLVLGALSTDPTCDFTTEDVVVELVAGDGSLAGSVSESASGGVVTFTDLAVTQGSVDFDAFRLRAFISGEPAEVFSDFFSVSLHATLVTSGDVDVMEGNGETFSVKLFQAPTSDVTVAVTSSDVSVMTIAGTTDVTFSTGNWDTLRTLSVTTVDDSVFGARGAVAELLVSSDDAVFGAKNDGIAVSVADDETAAVLVAALGATTVLEAAGEETFGVKLASEPNAAVTVDIVLSSSFATVSSSALTFLPAEWSDERTLTVTGVEDAMAVSPNPTTGVLATTSSSHFFFDALTASLTYEIIDNETPAYAIAFTDASAVSLAEGSYFTFPVVLMAQPNDAVTVTVNSNTPASLVATPSTLTFSIANFATTRTVTISAIDNEVDGFSDPVMASFYGDVQTLADFFNSVSLPNKAVNIYDDESSAVLLSSTASITVAEGAVDDSIALSLDAQPTEDVTVDCIPDDAAVMVASNLPITFSTSNYATAVTMTLSAVQDNVDYQTLTTFCTIDVSSGDWQYDPISFVSPDVEITDDDVAQMTVSPASVTITESATPNTASATLVLDTMPTSVVTVSLLVADTDIAVSSTGSVTFGTGNFNSPVTFTVTGVDNSVDDVADLSTTVSSTASSSDGAFDGVVANVLAVELADEDVRGATVSASAGSASENGGMSEFSVVLDTEPLDAITLEIDSADTNVATVTPSDVTFSTANWSDAASVTVTGVDNIVTDDPDATVQINFDIVSSGDSNFDAVAPTSFTFTALDDDATSGINVILLGSATISEAAGETSFSVSLSTAPSDSVTVEGTASLAGATTVSTDLTFTVGDWNVVQFATVTAVENDVDLAVSPTTSIAFEASSDDGDYDNVASAATSVEITDNDVAAVSFSGHGAVSVAEAGGTDTFTVVLDTEPTADVVISFTPDESSLLSSLDFDLTFTAGNYDTIRTVTVTGTNNDIDLNADPVVVALAVDVASTDLQYNTLTESDVSVDIAEDDTAAVSVSDSSITVVEAAVPNTETSVLELATEPTSEVTVAVVSSNTGVVTITPSTITFDSSDYDTGVTLSMAGVDNDNDVSVNPTAAIQFTLTSDDGAYDGLTAADIAVELDDEDISGISLSAASGSGNENGGTATYTISLNTSPAGDVTVAVVSSSTSIATVSVSHDSFTSANFASLITVSVTAVDNDVDLAADSAASVSINLESGADSVYDSLVVSDFTFTSVDDDTVGVTLAGDTSLTVDEDGGTDSFTVVLDTEPTADVVITLSLDGNELSTSDSPVTFSSADFNTAQTVTLTGVNDDVAVSVDPTGVVGFAFASADGMWDAFVLSDVSIELTDDDAVGLTLGGSTTPVITEGGSSTLTLSLESEPTSLVTVTMASDDTTSAVVAPSPVVFDDSNYATLATVTLGGVDDDVDDADSTASVSFVFTSDDGGYEGMSVSDVTISVTDDDTAGLDAPVSDVTVVEDGATGTVSFRLDSEPTGLVSITASPPSELSLTPSSVLVFDDSNWSDFATLTVSGVDNDVDDTANPTVTLTFAITSPDGVYNGMAVADIDVEVTDDDTAGVTGSPPSLGIAENGGQGTVTLVLDSKPTSPVTVSTVSSDAGEMTVFANAAITFSIANWSTAQSVVLAGVDDATMGATVETATSTASSDDGKYNGADVTTTVTLVDNEAPSFVVSPSTVTVVEGDTSSVSIALSVAPASEVTLTLTSNAPSVAVAASSLTFTVADFSTAQQVAISGVDNQVDAVSVEATTFDIATESDDANFDGLVEEDALSVTIADDDTARIVSVPSTPIVDIGEGTSLAYAVRLATIPSTDVTVSLALAADGLLTSDLAAPLTFTSGTYSTAQSFSLTMGSDAVDVSSPLTSSFTFTGSSGDGKYDGLVLSRQARQVDDDVAAIGFSANAVYISAAESSNSDMSVVLATRPSSSVTVAFAAAGADDDVVPTGHVSGLASPPVLVFAPAAFATAQIVGIAVAAGLPAGEYRETLAASFSSSDVKYTAASLAGHNVTVWYNVSDPLIAPTVQVDGAASVSVLAGSTSVLATRLIVVDENGVGNGERISVSVSSLLDAPVAVDATTVVSGTKVVVTLLYTGGLKAVQDSITVVVEDETGLSATASLSVVVHRGLVVDAATVLPVVLTENQAVAQSTRAVTFGLDFSPSADVPVTISVGGGGGVVLSSTATTLSAAQRNFALSLSSVDNDVVDGSRQTVVVVSAPGMLNLEIPVSVLDDDVAGLAAVSSVNNVTYESGQAPGNETNVVTVSLFALRQPTSEVTVRVLVGTPEVCSVSPSVLVVQPDPSFFDAQVVTVTAVSDNFDRGDLLQCEVSFSQTESDDAAFAPEPPLAPIVPEPSAFVFTVVDDDVFGLSVTVLGASEALPPVDGHMLEIGEGADGGFVQTPAGERIAVDGNGGISVAVVLTAEPLTGVFSVDSGSGSQIAANPSSLTFDGIGQAWSDPIVVHLSAVDDDKLDGDVLATVFGVNVTAIDNEVQEIAYAGTETLIRVDEDAGAVSIDLTTRYPLLDADELEVRLESGDQSVIGVIPGSVSFPLAGNDIKDGGRNMTIVVSPADEPTRPVIPLSVSVSVEDNDVPSLVNPDAGDILLTAEEGTTATFALRLGCEPRASVVVALGSSDVTEGTLRQDRFTWTAANWDRLVTVTVEPVDDEERDSIVEYFVETTAVTSADADFNDETVTLRRALLNKDDEFVGVQVSPVIELSETGSDLETTKQVLFVLTLRPFVPVDIDIAVASQGRFAFETTSFQLPDELPVVYSISAADNLLDDGDVTVQAIVTGMEGDVPVPGAAVDITVRNDDTAALVRRSPSTRTVVDETGRTGAVSVALATEPFARVVVGATMTDSSEAAVSPRTLTFDSSNWSAAQNVTVSGVADADNMDGDVQSALSFVVATTNAARDAATYGQLPALSHSVVTEGIIFPSVDADMGFPLSPFGGGALVTIAGDFFMSTGTEVHVKDALSGSEAVVRANVTQTRALTISSSTRRRADVEVGKSLAFIAPPMPSSGDRYVQVQIVNPDGGGAGVVFDQFLYYSNTCPEENTVLSPTGDTCIPCPRGARCPGGNRIIPLEGYWAENESSGYVVECEISERCVGGQAEACVEGYSGVGCNECADGFYRTDGTCEACGTDNEAQTALLLLAVAVAIIFGLFILACWTLTNGAMTNVAIVIIQVQLIQKAGSSAVRYLPSSGRAFYSFLSIIKVDISFVRAECASGEFGFVQIYGVTLGMIFAVLVPLVVGLEVIGRVRRDKLDWYRRRQIRSILVSFAIVYLTMTKRVFEAIYCYYNPKGDLVLHVEPETVCYTGGHLYVALSAYFLLAAYVFGVPLGLGLWIRRKRKTRYDAAFCDKFGFFFEGFHHRQYLFGSSMFLVPMTVSFSSVVLVRQMTARFILVLIVATTFLVYFVLRRPYRRAWKNWVTMMALVVTVLSAVLAFSYGVGAGDGAMKAFSWTLFLLSVLILLSFIAVVVLALVTDRWRARFMKKDSSESDIKGRYAPGDNDEGLEMQPVSDVKRRQQVNRDISDLERSMYTSNGLGPGGQAAHANAVALKTVTEETPSTLDVSVVNDDSLSDTPLFQKQAITGSPGRPRALPGRNQGALSREEILDQLQATIGDVPDLGEVEGEGDDDDDEGSGDSNFSNVTAGIKSPVLPKRTESRGSSGRRSSATSDEGLSPARKMSGGGKLIPLSLGSRGRSDTAELLQIVQELDDNKTSLQPASVLPALRQKSDSTVGSATSGVPSFSPQTMRMIDELHRVDNDDVDDDVDDSDNDSIVSKSTDVIKDLPPELESFVSRLLTADNEADESSSESSSESAKVVDPTPSSLRPRHLEQGRAFLGASDARTGHLSMNHAISPASERLIGRIVEPEVGESADFSL